MVECSYACIHIVDFTTYEKEYETWNEWADRMAKEHAARHHPSMATDRRRKVTDDKNGKAGGPPHVPKISPHKRKQFEEKMRSAQEQHRRHLEQRRTEKIGLRKLRYERDCIALFSPDSRSTIGYDDVPWPHPPGKDVTPLADSVAEFLFGDLLSGSDTYRSYLRLQRVRWHPDRFSHRCAGRLKDGDRQKILDKVNAISQILNFLNESLSIQH